MVQSAKPTVAVIGCGGTISTVARDQLDFIEYPETGQKIGITEVLERMPELFANAELLPVSFRGVSSSAIGPREWLELHDIIVGLEREHEELTGVLIIHGTATLEETAYFLNLTLKTDLPVVLVGAQRPINTLGSDAAINALSGLRTAIDRQSRGKGVLVVLNDEIHAAREVTKTSTYRLHAFQTVEFGPIGIVDADRVTYYRHGTQAHTQQTPFHVTAETELPRVDILYAYSGADEVAVNAYVAAGAKGLVSAGFAPGMPPPKERAVLERVAEKEVLVVQSTRVGSGRVARRQYLRDKGWIGGNNLTPQKARILLMLSLLVTKDAERIQDFFDRF